MKHSRCFPRNSCVRAFGPGPRCEIVGVSSFLRISVPDNLKKVRPDPLDAPATFEVTRLNEGILRFSSNREIGFPGAVTYADDRKELREIQHDPLAIKELMVAQLMNIRGRLGGEMVRLRCFNVVGDQLLRPQIYLVPRERKYYADPSFLTR